MVSGLNLMMSCWAAGALIIVAGEGWGGLVREDGC
jgi:hypothetical protein